MLSDEEIRTQLAEFGELMAARDVARLGYQAAREVLIGPEIRSELAANIDYVEKEIRQAVLALGTSVKGAHLHALDNKPRVNWDAKGLDRYAALHPDIVVLRSENDPSVALRKN